MEINWNFIYKWDFILIENHFFNLIYFYFYLNYTNMKMDVKKSSISDMMAP